MDYIKNPPFKSGGFCCSGRSQVFNVMPATYLFFYSTVTDFARFLGWSTLSPLAVAV